MIIKNHIFLLFLVLLFLSGCVNIPNYNSKDEYNSSKSFRYGKYCGKGHPSFTSKPGSAERTKDLMSIWPPIDDVDMMCYAHDMCYQIVGASNALCDSAFAGTTTIQSRSFTKKSGCSNLVNLVGSGIRNKFWSKEDVVLGSATSTMAGLLVMPFSLAIHALHNAEYKKYGFPSKEGSCYRNDKPRIHAKIIISDFEAEFREIAELALFESEKKAGKNVVNIPAPVSNWEQQFLIFETQKYLNYFKYDAGPADGKFEARTKIALQKYQKSKSIKFSDQPNENTLLQLKHDYLNRPGEDVFNHIKLSNKEFDSLYGYLE